MLCAIWYYLYNLRNVKNTYGGVLLLKPATLLKVTVLHGCFSRFLNCINGTKSRNAPHISSVITELQRNAKKVFKCYDAGPILKHEGKVVVFLKKGNIKSKKGKIGEKQGINRENHLKIGKCLTLLQKGTHFAVTTHPKKGLE